MSSYSTVSWQLRRSGYCSLLFVDVDFEQCVQPSQHAADLWIASLHGGCLQATQGDIPSPAMLFGLADLTH